MTEALALQDAGAFAIIFEAVPAKLAEYVTKKLRIPTISIGGGLGCSGQLLVTYEVLGMFDTFAPKFAKKYANFNKEMKDVFTNYHQEVLDRKFPSDEHVYGVSDEVMDAIEIEFGKANRRFTCRFDWDLQNY